MGLNVSAFCLFKVQIPLYAAQCPIKPLFNLTIRIPVIAPGPRLSFVTIVNQLILIDKVPKVIESPLFSYPFSPFLLIGTNVIEIPYYYPSITS